MGAMGGGGPRAAGTGGAGAWSGGGGAGFRVRGASSSIARGWMLRNWPVRDNH